MSSVKNMGTLMNKYMMIQTCLKFWEKIQNIASPHRLTMIQIPRFQIPSSFLELLLKNYLFIQIQKMRKNIYLNKKTRISSHSKNPLWKVPKNLKNTSKWFKLISLLLLIHQPISPYLLWINIPVLLKKPKT